MFLSLAKMPSRLENALICILSRVVGREGFGIWKWPVREFLYQP
jgi:hypothetical protein